MISSKKKKNGYYYLLQNKNWLLNILASVLLQKTTKALGLVSEKILANHDSMDRGGIIISSLIFSAKLRKENKSS